IIALAVVGLLAAGGLSADAPAGFVPLFNGHDLTGWKIPEGDNGHWKVVNGVIDYDARSESQQRDKSLWTEKSFKDFVLRVDWRLKTVPGFVHPVPVILPNGEHQKDAEGRDVTVTIDDVDSGIYLRGYPTRQVIKWKLAI